MLTFCLALCCLPLVCEAGSYCYTYSYNGYTSYTCRYYMSYVDRFGIAYGTVTGIGLLVALIIFIACKSRQRPNNSTILLQPGYPGVAYAQSGQQVIFSPQPGIIQAPAQQTTINSPAIPFLNQQGQTSGAEPAATSTMGAIGTTPISPDTQESKNKTNNPPPYCV
ncbi:uncharacterized protein LOC133184897 [Saccostrea echinata]|uniref:uncharacterized protein LOC133184897 n=1 Tax=Saccostrea echinata TaxID=191078 RepID=UPI002A8411B8|nr:uncharacterized protein LOC133184897 [Saccostrea echinata]